ARAGHPRNPAEGTGSDGDPGMSTAKPAPAKKRGLGRGLEALLGPKGAAEAPKLEATESDTLSTLPVDALRAGKYQPRRQWDAGKLTELAESIKVGRASCRERVEML